jgi:hypothetical protein
VVVRGKLNPTKEIRAPHTLSKNVKSKRIKSKTKHTHTHTHKGSPPPPRRTTATTVGLQLYEKGAQLGGLTTDKQYHITNQQM